LFGGGFGGRVGAEHGRDLPEVAGDDGVLLVGQVLGDLVQVCEQGHEVAEDLAHGCLGGVQDDATTVAGEAFASEVAGCLQTVEQLGGRAGVQVKAVDVHVGQHRSTP